MAEEVRFELTDSCPSPVFKTGALNRSATLPDFKTGMFDHTLLTAWAWRFDWFDLPGGHGPPYYPNATPCQTLSAGTWGTFVTMPNR